FPSSRDLCRLMDVRTEWTCQAIQPGRVLQGLPMSRQTKRFAIAGAVVVVLAVPGAAVVGRQLMAELPHLSLHKMTVTAQFEDAVGLYEGNGVSVLGMEVGKVTSIAPKGGYVEVKLAIDTEV